MSVYALVRTERHGYDYGNDKSIIVAHVDVEWVKNYAVEQCCSSSININYEIVEFIDGHETLNYFSIDA